MAATLTETLRIPIGQSGALCAGTVTLDSSYLTGGEPIDAIGDLGYDTVIFECAGGVVLEWVKSTQAVKAYWGNAGSASLLPEVTSTTDLSAVVAQYIALAAAA